jgi:hypothetical protein
MLCVIYTSLTLWLCVEIEVVKVVQWICCMAAGNGACQFYKYGVEGFAAFG